jgi:hypothetical protein
VRQAAAPRPTPYPELRGYRVWTDSDTGQCSALPEWQAGWWSVAGEIASSRGAVGLLDQTSLDSAIT